MCKKIYKRTEEMLVTNKVSNSNGASNVSIERFHSRVQQPCKNLLEQKKCVYIRKEFNSSRIGLGKKHGRRFIVFGQHSCRDVM